MYHHTLCRSILSRTIWIHSHVLWCHHPPVNLKCAAFSNKRTFLKLKNVDNSLNISCLSQTSWKTKVCWIKDKSFGNQNMDVKDSVVFLCFSFLFCIVKSLAADGHCRGPVRAMLRSSSCRWGQSLLLFLIFMFLVWRMQPTSVKACEWQRNLHRKQDPSVLLLLVKKDSLSDCHSSGLQLSGLIRGYIYYQLLSSVTQQQAGWDSQTKVKWHPQLSNRKRQSWQRHSALLLLSGYCK